MKEDSIELAEQINLLNLKDQEDWQGENIYQINQPIIPNPSFQVTLKRHINNHGNSLFYYNQGFPIVWRAKIRQNCLVFREQINRKIFIDFVSENDAKYGLIPSEDAQLLMTIKLLDNQGEEQSKKHLLLIPEPVCQKQRGKNLCKRMEKVIFKCIDNSFDENQLHRIQKGDQFRFGLQNFRVVDVCADLPLPVQVNQQVEILIDVIHEDLQNQPQCKFCYESDNQPADPLFQPCKCKGSCQFIHLFCFKRWINNNLQTQIIRNVNSYKWNKFQCQLCKYSYPLSIRYNGQQIKLADYQVPNEPHLILERIKQSQKKRLYVITARQEFIKIGRTHDNDLAMNWNSISRNHALIVFRNGNFYIKDTNSTFGTLVRIKKQLRIHGKTRIQVGDVSIQFDQIKKTKQKQLVI